MPKQEDSKRYSIFDGLKRKWPFDFVRQSKEWQGLIQAIKSDGFLILLGVLSGIGLVVLQHDWKWLNRDHVTTALIVEHLGLAFIVSSIAVFGYEWRSYAKKAFDLTEELVKLRQVEGIEAIDRGLEVVFGGEEHELGENVRKVFSSLKKVIVAIQDLNTNKSWASQQYIGFVSDLLDTAQLNAVNLSDLEKKEVSWKDFIVPVTASRLAGRLLTQYMMALGAGDLYEVISDFTSWQDAQLDEFHNIATKKAVANGAEVVRVFNLLSVGSETISESQIRETLTKHLNDAKQWPGAKGYKVKVFGPAEYAVLHKKFPQADRRVLMESHFGVFKHRNEIVCVMVKLANLSKMQLCSKLESIAEDVDKLENVIANARELKLEELDQLGVILKGLNLKGSRRRLRKQTRALSIPLKNAASDLKA